ncbi:BrnT family toxin [uncultured Tateyamaria sp.]|uniref:BrnT family toxin n=1 Tax=uncultured Tateyamaria sp. TaxID=455651 RepID=UPI00260220A5|nr:BrnT family toxin [uncultured Tateyamaria sp.]
MKLAWDEGKRQDTLRTRKLDFADVAHIDWDTAIIFDDERRDYGEHRQVVLGKLRGRLVVVAFTEREGVIRVISMRKANSREGKIYDTF